MVRPALRGRTGYVGWYPCLGSGSSIPVPGGELRAASESPGQSLAQGSNAARMVPVWSRTRAAGGNRTRPAWRRLSAVRSLSRGPSQPTVAGHPPLAVRAPLKYRDSHVSTRPRCSPPATSQARRRFGRSHALACPDAERVLRLRRPPGQSKCIARAPSSDRSTGRNSFDGQDGDVRNRRVSVPWHRNDGNLPRGNTR